jgi:hypothetical protein
MPGKREAVLTTGYKFLRGTGRSEILTEGDSLPGVSLVGREILRKRRLSVKNNVRRKVDGTINDSIGDPLFLSEEMIDYAIKSCKRIIPHDRCLGIKFDRKLPSFIAFWPRKRGASGFSKSVSFALLSIP